MKIAIIAPSPVPYTIGGAEKLWWGMLDAFRRHTDHEIELIKVPSPERNFREIVDSYYYFSKLDLNHFDLVISTKYPAWMVWHGNHWVYLQHRLRGLYDTYPADMPRDLEEWPEALGRLRELLALAPHVDHRDEMFSVVGDLKANLPPQQWDDWFALPGPLSRAVTHWLDDSAMRAGMIKKYMAISNNVAGRADYFPSAVPVQVIHHPSDLLPAVSSGSEYLFTASRLDAPKRLDLLVRGMIASSAEMPLLIAGSGPQQAELEQLAATDERIHLLGRITDAQMRRYYGGALCVPFLPMDEDYGLITVEAMQAGKPVLTCTDTGGVTELVDDGCTGWVVEPTETAIAAAIEQITAAPDQAIAMADACRTRVAGINWPDTLAAILDESICMDARGFLEQGKPRHILVPLTFPVFPPRSGGQNRVFHLYRRIAQYVPVTLLTLCNAEEAPLDEELAPGLRELRIPKSEAHQAAERAAEQELCVSIGDLYAIEHMPLSPEYLGALRELTLQADLVIASHPYLYPAIRSVYRGRIYYEAHNVEFDMKRDILRDLPGAEPWLELARATESACCLDAVGVCACSEQDRDRLHDLYAVPLGAIEVVPNGVAAGEIPCVSTHQRRRSARRLLGDYRAAAVFIGSWHGPNNEAMAWIIEHLAPRLPGICFWIIGSVCNYWEKGGNKSAVANVVLLGQLDEADKNAALSCAQVALNPVISGSGSNLKMAEYVASGLAVLSTPFGCRGFELDGLHSVRVAELEGFAEELERLVDQPAEGSPREDKWTDREVVIENHDWNDIADGYFAHLVSVYANSVYNRRPGTTGVFLE